MDTPRTPQEHNATANDAHEHPVISPTGQAINPHDEVTIHDLTLGIDLDDEEGDTVDYR